MKTSHTPGSWTIGNGIRHTDTIGINKHRPSDDPEIGEYIETIAEVLPAINGTDMADARLIAAAPELLDALRTVYELVPFDFPENDARVAIARDLILKLTQP